MPILFPGEVTGAGASLGSTTPAPLGTAAAGVATTAARSDHVHASIVDASVAAGAAIAESKLALAADAAVGTASRRTIGTGALQAAAGADLAASQAALMPLANAVETMPRHMIPSSSVNALATQRLYFMFFVATRDMLATQFKLPIAGTAAASITLARLGLYTAPNADGTGMTCVAASANSTTLGNATFATAVAPFGTSPVGGQAMPANYQLVRGNRYAIGVLFVGTTMPLLYGGLNIPAISTDTPRICGSLASQSDLVLNPGALSNTVASVYAAVAA